MTMDDDDLVYWQGRAVGCYEGGVIVWFPGAPAEAIAALSA
jgi:hypothetical protein